MQTRAMRCLEALYPNVAQRATRFVSALFERARRNERHYAGIMSRHCGDPSGVEFRHLTWQRWGVILPDASVPGKTRIQYFTPFGMSKHDTLATLEEAVEALVEGGYVIEDAGALDRMFVRWQPQAA
ncbi:MAG: hypothetical protein KJZ92_14550 [Rhodocyclaceae bacterium]|nr:hypothetical protein [Rhodocyclaceae bacterium]